MAPHGAGVDSVPRRNTQVTVQPPARLIAILVACWLAIILVVTATLAAGEPSSARSQLVGNVSILSAITFCLIACVQAARKPTAARLGWSLMAVGMALGALGQVAWVSTAISGTQAAPSAVGDTLGFLGYFLPTVAAVFAFPRRSELLISRYRQLLDVLVITFGVILVSQATVLGAVMELADLTTLSGWLHLAYPVADIAICALVLCLGMRQLPGDRLTWLVLGGGLLVVAITDSIYVRLLNDGADFLTATPLAAGWMLGPVLIGLATLIPMTGRSSRGRDYTLLLQLLPYIPAVGAFVVLCLMTGPRNPMLLLTAGLLLATLAGRQIMIVYENVSLTRDLEAKVASRTVELTTLGSIVTSSNDAIVGVSRDNVITAWNPAAERLYGYSAADVIGGSPELLGLETRSLIERLLGRADRGERLEGYEVDWRRPDGVAVPVAMTISPIVGAERVEGISVYGQDITERRRAAQALEQAREEALASSRMKSEFLATMSHEIRTPMNAVIGLTSLLLESDLGPTQRRYALGVQSAGEALLRLIDDILDFSKLEAGKVVLDRVDFNPRRLVEEVGAMMAPAASAKGLELIAFCLPDVPVALHGDAGRIRQILLNLASNAVKFTSRGEVVIKVSALSEDHDRTRLKVEVSDTGIGIAPEDQGRLFESFSQADASTTRRFGGTGLGLAISRRLVEVMGGTIGLESEVDIGSTFSVELTLRTATKAEPSIDGFPHDLLSGLRVLVVDDNATNRTLLKTQLEAWSMRTEVADSATAAFELLRSTALQGSPYDLVALDAHMPDVDGLQLARQVSADPVLRGSSMIMLTSGPYPDPDLMRAAGIAQWLPKPVRSAELFDRLVRLMAPQEKELEARRRYAESGAVWIPAGGRALVVDDDPIGRIVVKRILSRLGFDVHGVSDVQNAAELVGESPWSVAVLGLDASPGETYRAAQGIRELEGAGRHTPLVGLLSHPTNEERERCLAVGFDQVISRPIDAVGVQAVLRELAVVALPSGVEPSSSISGSTASSSAPGSSGYPSGSDPVEPAVIDASRLADLAELSTPDGSSLMVTMVDSYVRRNAERAKTLTRAAEGGDLNTVIAITHELKGSSGTIGAQRVMQHSGVMEQQARDGACPTTEAISALLSEMDLAVHELTTLAAQPG